jgi:hypothetical protein
MSRSHVCADKACDAVAAPPTRHTKFTLIARLTPAFLPLPLLVLLVLPIPALVSPPSSPRLLCLKSPADVARLCWSAPQVHIPQYLSNLCAAHIELHFAHRSSLRTIILEGWILDMGLLLATHPLFHMFLCFIFILVSRSSFPSCSLLPLPSDSTYRHPFLTLCPLSCLDMAFTRLLYLITGPLLHTMPHDVAGRTLDLDLFCSLFPHFPSFPV